jgi:hypothetical protein
MLEVESVRGIKISQDAGHQIAFRWTLPGSGVEVGFMTLTVDTDPAIHAL